MAYECQTKSSSKPEESQKNSNFNGKTIPYPGFEPGTSGLAVGSHKHCTIGSVQACSNNPSDIPKTPNVPSKFLKIPDNPKTLNLESF
jgi:hypothetical protein